MKINLRSRMMRIAGWLVAGFFLLFLFRLLYGYTSRMDFREESSFENFFENFQQSRIRKNYASDSYKYQKQVVNTINPQNTGQININQKYEKTANIQTKTGGFDKDENTIRTQIKNYNGIIQFEEKRGRKGSRNLHLLIGIPPEKFDSFYVQVIKIGTLKINEITKIDKTNEYKELNAKKTSLEKTRNSLIELKKQSGKIEEYIELENRILETESQLQDLGVLLGNFDEENEFCTVKISVLEGETIEVSFLHRIKVAFEWAIRFYLQFMLIVLLCITTSFFILLIIDKLKLFGTFLKKMDE
jgi:hypothetical protein